MARAAAEVYRIAQDQLACAKGGFRFVYTSHTTPRALDLPNLGIPVGAIGLLEAPLNQLQFQYQLDAKWLRLAEGFECFALVTDRKSTRLNSSHVSQSRMPSSA